MSKLEKMLKSWIVQIELLELGKNEVVELIKQLSALYQISSADVYPAQEDDFSKQNTAIVASPKPKAVQMKNGKLALEVVYEGNLRSSSIISGRTPIGVIIPSRNIVLYYKGCYCGDRAEARKSLFRLPRGYEWHLMTEREAVSIRNIVKVVNETLQAIGGMTLGREEYMLGDDCLTKGHVRYTAMLV